MRCLVHQHSTALALPRPAPVGALVVAPRAIQRIDDRDSDEPADSTGRDQLARRGDHGAEPLLEADAERSACSVGSLDHRIGVAHLHREGLLDEHMRTSVDGLERERRMRRMRRADDDDVGLKREQVSVIGE